jgi:hypothetical protein
VFSHHAFDVVLTHPIHIAEVIDSGKLGMLVRHNERDRRSPQGCHLTLSFANCIGYSIVVNALAVYLHRNRLAASSEDNPHLAA